LSEFSLQESIEMAQGKLPEFEIGHPKMEFKFALFENSSLNVRPKSELVNDGKNNRLNFRGKSKLYGQKKLGEKITTDITP
jgi:hypothetical protein